MAVEAAGMWEQGWNTPILEADLWRMVLIEFGFQNMSMTPVSGIAGDWITEYTSMDEILVAKAKEGFTPVLLDPRGGTELEDFEHPKNALYVFGQTSCSLEAYLDDYDSVRMSTVSPGMLWAHQALVLVLYDRMVKAK